MKTKYACIGIIKVVTEENFNQGTLPDTEVYTMDEATNITASTVDGLIKAIGNYYCLDMKDVQVLEKYDENYSGVRWLVYERLELIDCSEPSEKQLEEWRKDEIRMWNARFEFKVEKRIVASLTEEECKLAGIH